MKIEKLPSGSYRIRQQYKGKRYTIVVDHKPSAKEATILMAQKLEESTSVTHQNAQKGTFDFYVDKYLSDKKKELSSSTIVGYRSIQKNLSEWFKGLNLVEITEEDVQKEVNDYSKGRSPKTTKNGYGLISTILAEYRPNLKLSISLPSAKQKAEYEPTTNDVERILEASVGTRYEVPFRLACLGLRRGEIIALTLDDLDENNVLTINKALAITENNTYEVKHTKTEESTRRILIPSSLADLIREQGYVYNGYAGKINQNLHVLQDKLGIPRFRLHTLRHFAAAYLHKEGFTEEQIMAWCGWKTADIMKRVYRYNLDPSESQKNIAESFGSLFD